MRRASSARAWEKLAPFERWKRVAHYYFNLCSDDEELTDVVGQSCEDDVAALEAALRMAGDVIQKRLFRNTAIEEGWIEVEDEQAHTVLTLPLRAAAY